MKMLFLWLLLLFTPVNLFAAMNSYCSAPPYVTRTVPPNIMVLMDNSADMMEPAYPDNDYLPSTTYKGYFKPQECYAYNQRFYIPEAPVVTKDASGNCTVDAPFRGNLLNWATTSKYDLLQKVLIGGNTVSKQGNSHTVLAIGGTFPARTYNGCVFEYNNGNLSITDAEPGTCGLLSPIAAFALNPVRIFGEMFTRGANFAFGAIAGELAGIGQAFIGFWGDVDLVGKAWAGALGIDIVSGSFDIPLGQPYALTLEMTGGDNKYTATWTAGVMTPAPAWLTKNSSCQNNGNRECYRQSYSGTPMVAGTYTFTVGVSDSDGNTPASATYTINVQPEPLRIITEALSDAQRDTYYEFVMTALGGAQFYKDASHPDPDASGGSHPPHYHWSASGLPDGLFINQETGKIYGIPTANGTSTVTIQAFGASSTVSTPVTFSLVVSNPPFHILTDSVLNATQSAPYLSWLEAAGGTTPYTWAASGLPTGLTLVNVSSSNSAYITGTPTVAGTFTVAITATDSAATAATKEYTLIVAPAAGSALQIATESPLPSGVRGSPYYADIIATGGSGIFNWSISGAPAGMIGYVAGAGKYRLVWTPTNSQDGTYTFTITVKDGTSVVQKPFTLTILRAWGIRKKDFAAKMELKEENFSDMNGNGIWNTGEFIDTNNNGQKDAGEIFYSDDNGNGEWDGKKGVFQAFWDANNPQARWGLTMYRDQAASTLINVSACIPASPASSFYTNIQNATAANSSPLGGALYGAINYFMDPDSAAGFSGCTSSDPIDNVPCRKNFLLVISSGSDITTGTKFTAATHPTDFPSTCNYTNPVVQNACYAYNKDLRPGETSPGKQNIYTYVVNTMGATNSAILRQAAEDVGGGVYYDATSAGDLEAQLTNALQDILSQAASGTAVSVLTTSSRGIGSMMQAYFLPSRLEGEREVKWTGYAQNIWIDPQDNLREDTVNDYWLDLENDNVAKLYFDNATNQTKAAVFNNDDLDDCTPTAIREFDQITYTWEGGKKLALKDPGTRTLFTATKFVYGTTTTDLPSSNSFETSMDSTLLNALGADASDTDAPFTAEEIVRYVRGECLETVNGDNDCEAIANGLFRDRRVDVGGSVNGNVWKLGDIISSTPKVLANTPVNTYHIDYGDSSYYAYVSGTGYKQRSAMAFVGANDGVLHAFRVGYLQDKDLPSGLPATIKAVVKNAFLPEDDLSHDEVGEEVWGYIPFNTFPYLKYLASPKYGQCHMYFNDLSVRLVDASLGCSGDDTCDEPTDNRTAASWRTILIGGMRFGGGCNGGSPAPPTAGVGYSAYYAIDVTDAANPVPLWEFSDPDLGYATSFPSIVRTGAKAKNGNWYVVLGSGSTTLPKSSPSTDIGRSTPGYVYFLDLKTGELVKKAALDHNAIVGDILAIDANKDYGTEKLYFGTAYDASGVWKGKIVKMDLPAAGAITSAWTPTITYLFNDVYPITASVDAAKDAAGNTWVYAGSGKYFSDVDEVDSANQIILGMKDLDSPSPVYPWTHAALADQTYAQTTGTVSGTQEVCGFDGTSFGMQTVVTSVRDSSVSYPVGVTAPDADHVARGWFVTLSNGERVITRPLAVGGLVDFLTYAPSNNVCSYGGNSYLYAFNYTTGLAPANVAIRASATTGGVTSGSVTVARGVLLGPGAPPTGEAIIIPPPKEGQDQLKKKIQIATGVIVEAENTPVLSVISKIVHWLKK